MTDLDLLEQKLAFGERCVSELRRLAVGECLDVDITERRCVEPTVKAGASPPVTRQGWSFPFPGAHDPHVRAFFFCAAKAPP